MNKTDKQIEKLIDEEINTMEVNNLTDNTSHHSGDLQGDNSLKSDLNEEMNSPLSDSGETAFNADSPDLESDDDIDDVGEDFGVQYEDGEELDISKKIKMNSED